MKSELDKFLGDFATIINTLEKEQPIYDYGIHYTKIPFMGEYKLCVEVENIYGKTLDEIVKLGYEINLITAIRTDDERAPQKFQVLFKQRT